MNAALFSVILIAAVAALASRMGLRGFTLGLAAQALVIGSLLAVFWSMGILG